MSNNLTSGSAMRRENPRHSARIYFGLHPDMPSTYTFIFGGGRGSGPDRWIAQPVFHHPLVTTVLV